MPAMLFEPARDRGQARSYANRSPDFWTFHTQLSRFLDKFQNSRQPIRPLQPCRAACKSLQAFNHGLLTHFDQSRSAAWHSFRSSLLNALSRLPGLTSKLIGVATERWLKQQQKEPPPWVPSVFCFPWLC